MPLDDETKARIASDAADDLAPSARAHKRKFGNGPSAHAHGARDGDGGDPSRRSTKFSRAGNKPDPFSAASRVRRAIDNACQRDEFDAAMEAFGEAAAPGSTVVLSAHSCNVLLHLCAGGTGAWTTGLAPVECVRGDRADEIVEYMTKHDIEKSEMTYTAMVRVKAANGDVKGALDVIASVKAARLATKVRTYAPAIHACAASGDLDGMEAVEGDLRADGLLPTELEFMAMLRAYRAAEAYDRGFSMLRKMRTEIRAPSDEMSEELRAWFSSVPGWGIADEVSVGESGEVEAVLVMDEKRATFQLKAISVTEDERKGLLEAIAKLACEREAVEEFDNFMKWLDRKEGGMNAIVDGANVGMYNQNFSTSGMSFMQLEKVLQALRDKRVEGEAPPIAFLHQRRVENGPARKPQNQKLLEKWDSAQELFTTAHGSNDDWYWLYAAVHAGDGAYLVSNDECRDHVFQALPSPKLFYRWKERHQVRFSITAGVVELMYPPVFTTCMQEADDSSWWMFPQEDDTWLCAMKLDN